MEKTYKKPIHKIVAVVTPFKAQEAEIRHQIQKISGNEKYKEMIIGTVHSLQGAQCPIVLFQQSTLLKTILFLWSVMENTICSM